MRTHYGLDYPTLFNYSFCFDGTDQSVSVTAAYMLLDYEYVVGVRGDIYASVRERGPREDVDEASYRIIMSNVLQQYRVNFVGYSYIRIRKIVGISEFTYTYKAKYTEI